MTIQLWVQMFPPLEKGGKGGFLYHAEIIPWKSPLTPLFQRGEMETFYPLDYAKTIFILILQCYDSSLNCITHKLGLIVQSKFTHKIKAMHLGSAHTYR